MGALRIQWMKRAQTHFNDVSAWYEMNLGFSAARKFSLDVRETVDLLSQCPQIGTADIIYSNYYSFLIHPKYRLIYRFNKTTLFVPRKRNFRT